MHNRIAEGYVRSVNKRQRKLNGFGVRALFSSSSATVHLRAQRVWESTTAVMPSEQTSSRKITVRIPGSDRQITVYATRLQWAHGQACDERHVEIYEEDKIVGRDCEIYRDGGHVMERSIFMAIMRQARQDMRVYLCQ